MMNQEETLLRLETPRLTLRPFAESDFPLILQISSDPDTVKYLYYWGLNGITPEDDARRFLRYAVKNWQKRPIRAREYCVLLRETGEPIGDGSVEWVEGQAGTAEIGWILTAPHRGRGYATEMGRALMRAAFSVLGADRVIAHCDARNRPSARVMERLGMRLDALEKQVRPAKRPGEPQGDECTYGILRAEWETMNASSEP